MTEEQSNRWTAGRLARVAVVVAGFGFLVAAMVATWDTFVEALTLDPWRWLLAVVVSAAGLVVLAYSWGRVHRPGSDQGGLARGFLLAQPGKYVPGGVAMPVGQVALSRPYDTSTGTALARFVVHSLMMVVGAAWVTSIAAVSGPRQWLGVAALVVAIVGSATLVGADPDRTVSLVARLVSKVVPRWRDRRPELALGVSAGRRAQALAMTTLAMAMLAAPFPLVLQVDASVAAVAASFSFAWAVGFVLVPLPAGAGAREAALAFALSGVVGLGPLVAASILYRAAMLVAEALVATGSGLIGRTRGASRRPRTRSTPNMRSGRD